MRSLRVGAHLKLQPGHEEGADERLKGKKDKRCVPPAFTTRKGPLPVLLGRGVRPSVLVGNGNGAWAGRARDGVVQGVELGVVDPRTLRGREIVGERGFVGGGHARGRERGMGRRRAQGRGDSAPAYLDWPKRADRWVAIPPSDRVSHPPLLIPALFTSGNSPFRPRSEPTPPPVRPGRSVACHFTAVLHVLSALVTHSPPAPSPPKTPASLGQECQQKAKSVARDPGHPR